MKNNEFNRRDFLRLTGISTAGVLVAACGGAPAGGGEGAAPGAEVDASANVAAIAEGLPEVPRDKSFIFMFGGDGSQFTDVELGNPYATNATHQMGSAALWEPLYFYSAFADEEIPWLATGYEYNDDFTELTINLREGVEWSDGEPFNADDVVFTLNMLIENAPTVTRSPAVAAAVASAEAVDDYTVHITFNGPRPRFMFEMMMSKFDTGIYWVPEHVYKDVDDLAAFKFYDLEKGWPLATGPYKIVSWSPTQKIIDRRDDWWGVKTGFAEKLPDAERIIAIPYAGDTVMSQQVASNEVDSVLDLRANAIGPTIENNPQLITHTLREPPYGYMDWWPTSMWFNHEEGPFTDKRMRWAISYSIDRQQMLDVALQGSGILTELPFPQYAPMEKYFEAAKPLLEKYPTNEYNPEKAAALMQEMGYEKDGDGFWAKDGERVQTNIGGWQVFTDIGPIIAEQLRRNGFEAEFSTPADQATRISDGTAHIWLNGHGGTIADPYTTLDYYTSKYWAPIGEPTTQNSRYKNPEYDAILDEMANMSADDPAYIELYLAALEIYLDDLIDAPIQQWLHRIPLNTTYWDNWPTEENPYVNGAFWHLTFPIMLHNMVAVANE